MKKSNILALWTLLLIALPMNAVRHYKCDFESEAARNRWVMNPTANQNLYNQLKNKWYIGEPGNNDRNGHYGLFISDDNGQTAHFTNNAGCFVFAYDTVRLDHLESGDYTLYFDWCAMGNVASNFDGLYLFWIPASVSVNSIPSSSGTIPSVYDPYLIQLQPQANMDYLNGTSTWHQCAVTIPNEECDGTPHYLAFAWTNGSGQAQQPGAMIDNINITDNQPCDAPTNLTVVSNGTTVSLEWTGTGTDYEVSAYSYETGTWAGPKIVTGTQTSFTGLPIGQTDFIVRTVCDVDYYSLKTIVSKLIYYPDQLCVDYLNLQNAKCYINNSKPTNSRTFNDFKQVPAVDYGPSDKKSRHVVHFDRQETEPRTGGQAKTIPDGELASVRLGNWDNNDEAERIEFSFPIDTIKYPVLLLKYMPILEAPGHSDDENPRFKMDILIDNVTIGECGQADFNANNVLQGGQLKPGMAAQGWHVTPSAVAEANGADVVWKEWTTVGVNLKAYAGRGSTITARLTTHDCTMVQHCGYAYFTLGCSDGKLKGMKCGEINPVFEAPDGFVYRWAYAYDERYRRADGSFPEQYVRGRGQTLDAGYQDDSLYVVDCMFVQDSSCYFSLYASTLATNPISIMRKPVIIKNCAQEKYTVKFDGSRSWVQEIDHVTGDTLVSKAYHIDTYEWVIEGIPGGWSDEPSPSFAFPLEGGVFPYSLRTTCGTCESIVRDTLRLAPLGPTHEERTITLCDADRKGAGFVWEEKPDTVYKTYCTDSVVLFNPQTSCDSIIHLQLIEPHREFVDTMLLPESLPFTFMGRTYGVGTTSLVDTIPAATNCALTWVLNLEIYESLIASMPNAAYMLCQGDPTLSLIYDIARGRSLRYFYTFDNPAIPSVGPVHGQQAKGQYQIDIPIDATVLPNDYTGSLLLIDSMPEFNVTIPFTVSLRYASDVVAQRWNDVLAIKNYDYNGGYEFDSVQWYVNGMPIEGAIDFNYYAGEGNQLRFGEEYQALLLRRSDGVKQFTCPFIPVAVSADVTDMPSLVPPSAPMQIKGKGTATWYDMLGRIHHSENYDSSAITTPSIAGYYLLVLQADDTRSAHRIVVR